MLVIILAIIFIAKASPRRTLLAKAATRLAVAGNLSAKLEQRMLMLHSYHVQRGSFVVPFHIFTYIYLTIKLQSYE